MGEENKKEEVKEVKSVTNNFYAPVTAGVIGNEAKIETQNFNQTETSKSSLSKVISSQEKIAIKKWKNKSVNFFFISLFITLFIVLSYIFEFEIIMSKANWVTFKSSEWFKWIGLVIAFVWNSIVGKMWYERNFDPSKENAFIDLYRKKK